MPQQMLAATAPTHADHALLKEAVREIKRVADFVNEKKREVEARARVGEIQTKMAGDCPVRRTVPALLQTLVTETRRLIRDADVVALSGSDRSDRGDRSDRELRHLFLFNDAILCVTFVESQTTLTKVRQVRPAPPRVSEHSSGWSTARGRSSRERSSTTSTGSCPS